MGGTGFLWIWRVLGSLLLVPGILGWGKEGHYTICKIVEVVMFLLILIFGIFHSGLASLQDAGEKLIDERAFRVLFAGTSLPLAVTTVVYFINHRYDEVQLWDLKNVFGLIGHHLFGVWNSDRRLAIRYGEAFELVKKRTSIIPFAAILDGRQKLPKDYYKEFIRLPYLSITAITLGVYFALPLMQAASFRLHW